MLRAALLMYNYISILYLVHSFLPSLALSEVNGEKELGKNVKAMIQGMELLLSLNDRTDKVMSSAQQETTLGNRWARNARQDLNIPLHVAVSDRNLEEVTTLLDQGEDVNVKGNNGVTPLMLAAGTGELDIVNLIISRNASLEIKDEFDNAAIHHAAKERELSVLKTLLNLGADVNIKGNIGMTPLMFAAEKGYLNLVNFLISRNLSLEIKDELDNTALHHAVKQGNLDVIKALLDHGANVNVKGANGLTPLMVAVGKHDVDAVNLLISRNAILEIKDEINNAAIHHAAKKGNLRVLKTLLNHGVNVDDKRNIAIGPLILAAWKSVEDSVLRISRNTSLKLINNINDAAKHIGVLRRHLLVFKTLYDRAANVNSKGENGNTPLILALVSEPKSTELLLSKNINSESKTYCNMSIKSAEKKEILTAVKILVEHGAEVNSRNLIGRTALHEAAIRGYAGIANYLLSQNASFIFEDNFCYTPFHWAANNSKIDVIKTLLEYGDDVNRKGCNNVTALHLAIERNDSKLMEFLLSKSADPNVMREDGRTPLDVAFQRSLKPFIKLLLDHGARVEDNSFLGSKILFGAVANKSLELVRLLLDKTVNFDTYPTVILNYAIGTKFLEGTKLLIFHGANIELKDIHGNVPLSSAVLSRKIDLVKLILETGAKIIAKENMKTFIDADSNVKVFSTLENATEIHRLSPIHIAAYHGLMDVTGLLISYGASLEVRDERNYTPLHYATENGHVEVVKILLDSGANKSSTNIHGMVPVHLACKRGLFAIVQLLLSVAPVDIDLADNYGYTPLHFAVMNGSSKIVKLLLNLGADIDARSDNLTTPLHLASLEGHEEIVKILLIAGVDQEASDVDDMTPLHFAARERYPEIVKLILKARGFSYSRNKNGSSPLHLTCGSYNTKQKPLPSSKDLVSDTIQKFKDELIFTNDQDNNKMTVLHVASRDGASTCVEQLLESHSVTLGDIQENSPLHYAALNGHTEIIRMILKEDGEVRRKVNIYHETPLMLASREGHTDVVMLLLQGAVDDFRPDINGRTPLHRSACRGHLEIVKLLLSSMAKRDAEDKWGFTPLNYAASWKGYQDVIGYLSTSQLNITLSYYFNVSDPFQRNSAKITKFFI